MKPENSPRQKLITLNRKYARMRWAALLNRVHFSTLKELSLQFGFSLAMGDITLLEGRWYVTHTGLIRLARHKRCAGIHVRPVPEFSDPSTQRWAFEATVYKSRACRGFVGYGDADPSNVSPLVRGAEMRVAETRSVNRALRKAYGIGICSIEEIGTCTGSIEKLPPPEHEWQWERQQPESSGPTVPDHPPAQARSRTRKGLRRRLLRYENSQRCQQGTGRKLRPATGRLGREGP